MQPKQVCLTRLFRVIAPMLYQHPCQDQRHLGIVGRLPGNRPPSPAVRKLSDATRVFGTNLFQRVELYEAAQASPASWQSKQPCARERVFGSTDTIETQSTPLACRPQTDIAVDSEASGTSFFEKEVPFPKIVIPFSIACLVFWGTQSRTACFAPAWAKIGIRGWGYLAVSQLPRRSGVENGP